MLRPRRDWPQRALQGRLRALWRPVSPQERRGIAPRLPAAVSAYASTIGHMQSPQMRLIFFVALQLLPQQGQRYFR